MTTVEYLQSLIRELSKLTSEEEWVEFKCNNDNPERMAKYISGMSNVATLLGKTASYIVWGINNDTHEIVGTDFNYRLARKGNEELEAWLVRMVNPKIDFHFYEVPMGTEKSGKEIKCVLLEIPAAESEPTRYESTAYIRIGSNLKPLQQFKEKEAELWRKFDTKPVELRVAKPNVTADEVAQLLDFSGYYEVLNVPIPSGREQIMEDLQKEKFISPNDAGHYDILNYGALMIGRNLKSFEGLERRGVRVIRYKDNDRINGISEKEFSTGYSIDFDSVVEYIMTITPHEEQMDGSIRKSVSAFPELAVRELLANAMIHQDLNQKGTNPMVEVFSDRIEFSNAGAPLVAIDRIVDTVPVSRNENMAGFMHRCGICEERGSGYDKIVEATSSSKLLAPKVENQNNQFTKAVLFAKVPFAMTTKEDRIRTCYMQACLAYVTFGSINNSDMREVFDLPEKDKAKVSRIIKDTLNAGLIKPLDPDTAPRYMRYIPVWA